MSLRLALLLVSLILIGLIGLVCHIKYRQLNPKKRLNTPGAASEVDALLDEDINAPFINENIISDIPHTAESLLKPVDPQKLDLAQPPQLKTSHEELVDKKKIAQLIAEELLPVYKSDQFIFEHAAILPNIKIQAAEIQKIVDMQPARLKNNIAFSGCVKKQTQFSPLEQIKGRHKITHLKSEFSLKQKSGFTDDVAIKEYEAFVDKLSKQFDCEYRFALNTDEIIDATNRLKSFIKEHDLIVILYILAKPEDTFSGINLQQAMTEAGLNYGEFKFFHCRPQKGDNQNKKLFSVANMYKPGSFDLESIEKFSTMGLCAFMVPALITDPVAGFSEMCTRCHEVANRLSGVLTTNKRELLNEDNYKHICNLIIQQKDKLNENGIDNGSEIANQLFT